MGQWKPAPLADGAYSDDSRALSDQQIINLLVCPAEKQGTRTRVPKRSCPGLQEFANLGDKRRQRGAYVAEGRLFVVGDDELCQIQPTGQVDSIGTIPGTSRISAAHNKITNGNEVKFVTGTAGYVYNTVTETLTQITDASYPGEKTTRYIGSLFVGVEAQGRAVVVSGLADGLSYNALEQFDGESSPDRIVAAEPSHGELVVFNQRTIEHFAYTGETNELFQNKIATIDLGLASSHAVNSLDNHLYFVGSDGSGYYLNGYTPVRVTTHCIEQDWATCDLSKSYSFVWEDRGWKLWIVTCPDGKTWAYDVAASAALGEPVWIRRQSYGMDRWRPAWLLKWNDDWYAGEHNSGRIFKLRWDYFLEGSDTMERRIRTGVLHDNANRLSFNALRAEVDCAGPVSVASGVYPLRVLEADGNVPDGVTGTVVSYRYRAIGGRGPYTWAVTSGSLPPGVTMDATGLVSGTYTTGGSYSWTVTVTDSAGDTDPLADTALVTAALYLTGDAPDGVIGAPYSFSYTPHSGTAPYSTWTISAGALPPGITLNPTTGALSGTPTTAGSYSWTVRLVDSAAVAATLADSATIPVAVFSFNLNGKTNAGITSAVGYTIPHTFAPGETLTLALVAATYTAWSPYDHDAGNEAVAWRCNFRTTDPTNGEQLRYTSTPRSTAALALAAAQAAGSIVITGVTGSIVVWIYDTPATDNRGGLSFEYTVT